MKKTISIIVLILVIIIGGYFAFRSNPIDAPENADQVSNQQGSTPDTRLTNLERENNAQDFGAIDADFGAEVNAAAQ